MATVGSELKYVHFVLSVQRQPDHGYYFEGVLSERMNVSLGNKLSNSLISVSVIKLKEFMSSH